VLDRVPPMGKRIPPMQWLKFFFLRGSIWMRSPGRVKHVLCEIIPSILRRNVVGVVKLSFYLPCS
jgi:hypothetical protein